MSSFDGVVPALADALTKKNYTTLTPVQEGVLAPELRDADLLVSAQTGSGKTVAFGMSLAPTLMGDADRLPQTRTPMALVVAPTRELALQVKRELEWLYAGAGASLASCVGGMDMRTERQVLGRGAHIVVGTPGRLRDHIQRGSLDMSEMKAIVLDEADEMLDLGFREDLEFILDAAPAERRTLMFSATVPRPIVSLAKRFQRNAVRLETTTEQRQHGDIDYRALTVAPSDRENAIINVLRFYEAKSAIVFCATRESVNRMTSRFTNRGFSVVALSGELSQAQRTHALQSMRDGRARVCIATDVAARGLDLPDLELVIHSDLPQNSPALLHRSGRTGRAGRKGVSVLIVPYSQRFRAERLLQGARIEATWAAPPSAKEINERDDQRLLEDPALTEPVAEEEMAFASTLLAAHSPEQVAAAFVRLHRSGKSAPEDLQENPKFERGERKAEKRKPRTDFEGSNWFKLAVGHRQNAETRWLLPMLYKSGNVAKGDVGAIKVYGNETHVEIAASSVERFTQAIGPHGVVEKGINVVAIDGTPTRPDETGSAPADTPARPPSARPAAARAERPARESDDDAAPRDTPRPPRNKPSTESTGAYAGKKPRKTRAHRDEPTGDRPERKVRPDYKPAEYDAMDAPRSRKSYKPKAARDDAGSKGADATSPRKPFKARSDKPGSDKSRSEKPHTDKPYSGKPYSGKPASGKPKSGKTGLGKPGGKFRGVAGRKKDGAGGKPYKGKGPKTD
ncbi:MAG: DEAD/DEAH box helicase [Minwuia sp.]|nr:DEAD/DEAH box helicase [Minwuia sp.]